MESHEGRDDEGQHRCQDVAGHYEVAHLVIEALGVAERASNDAVGSQHNEQAGARAVEEHVHEELVVVEADAVCDPGAVMVHLEDASVTLRAVMAPVGLRLVAPLADAHTAVSLALHGGRHAHHRWLVGSGLVAGSCLLRGAIGAVQRASGGVQVLEILVDDFLRLSRLLLNQLVGELLIAVSLVFLARSVLLLLGSHHRNRLLTMRRVSAHVPLFVLGNVARICHDCAHNGNNKHRRAEGKDHGKSDSFFAQIVLLLLVIVPARIERNLAVVLSDRWVQIELGGQNRTYVSKQD